MIPLDSFSDDWNPETEMKRAVRTLWPGGVPPLGNFILINHMVNSTGVRESLRPRAKPSF